MQSARGARTIKNNPDRIKAVDRELERMGARVVQQWAVLEPYDFVNVAEEADNHVIARVLAELSPRGTVHIITLPAIPIDDFIARLTVPFPPGVG